jgi:spore germination protein YaaH
VEVKMRKKKGVAVLGIVLMFMIIIAGIAGFLLAKKYMPSREMADLQEYFGIEQEDEIPVIVNQEVVETKGIQRDGNVYFPLDMVKELFNDRFYYDYNEDILIYTMPTEMHCVAPGDTGYTLYDSFASGNKTYEKDYGMPIVLKENDTVYVEAHNFLMDYMYDIGNVQVTGEPERIVIQKIDWLQNVQYATITKNTALRKLGGVKSPILRNVEEGESVVVKEVYENWVEVVTQDGFVGFVQSKRINMEEGEAWECAEAKEEPEFTNLVRNKKINLAWHQSTSIQANAKITEVLAGTSGINVISPTWFALSDNNGNFTSLGEKWYVDTLHGMGIEVWGLISNFEHDMNTAEVLCYTSKRQYLIRNLIEQSKALGLDGINLDFEQISVDYGEDYIQFVRELSVACRLNGLVLSIDNYVPTGYTAHYNRKEQGIFADYVIIMGYDEHYSGSETAGSVASIGFVRDGIEMTLQEVPAEKVINAIPFYTRIWKEVPTNDGVVELSSEAAGMERIERLLSELNVEAGWNEECAQFYAEYELEGATYKIWMENEISIEEKMKLIKENNLAGVAEWKLGFQKNSVWDVINKYLQ